MDDTNDEALRVNECSNYAVIDVYDEGTKAQARGGLGTELSRCTSLFEPSDVDSLCESCGGSSQDDRVPLLALRDC